MHISVYPSSSEIMPLAKRLYPGLSQLTLTMLAGVLMVSLGNVSEISHIRSILERVMNSHLVPPSQFTSVTMHEYRKGHPRVLVIDESRNRYYARRDLQAWDVAWGSKYIVEEQRGPVTDPSSFDVLLCLGMSKLESACLSSEHYATLQQHQRINHVHGLRQILWRKDALCRTVGTLSSVLRRAFTFDCYLLPESRKALAEAISASSIWQKWIVKPLSRGEGRGIFLASTLQEIDTMTAAAPRVHGVGRVVQPLLPNPLLLEGRKFDLRCYVLLMSIQPLRAYYYREGLVRLAAANYGDGHGGAESWMTNTFTNMKYRPLSELVWTFSQLDAKLNTTTVVSPRALWSTVWRAIGSMLLAAEPKFIEHLHKNLPDSSGCPQCFQLLGVDVIVDNNVNAKVIEVNGLPSMKHSDSAKEYTMVKKRLARDLVAMITAGRDRSGNSLNTISTMIETLGLDSVVLRTGSCPCNPSDSGDLSDDSLPGCIDSHGISFLAHLSAERQALGGFKRLIPSPRAAEHELPFKLNDTGDPKTVTSYCLLQQITPALLAALDMAP